MTNKMHGGCLCGDVLDEATGNAVFLGNCHCRDCQRTSGGAFTPAIFMPEGSVKISGEAKYYESTADSSKKVSRGFCPISLRILTMIIYAAARQIDAYRFIPT